MRKYTLLNCLMMAGLLIGFTLMTSCEGPQGPAGPVGPAGPAGPQGEKGDDGTPGVSGVAACLECHNLDKKLVVTAQYEGSQHAKAETVARGGSASCAMCHGHEGFVETQYTGEDRTMNNFAFPTRIRCGTCHTWHQSLDLAEETDYALRTVDAVELLMYRAIDSVVVVDFEVGNGNLCVNCHQPRRSWEEYEGGSGNLGDGTFDQDSEHFGPHHGPHGTMLANIGGARIVGSAGYPANPSSHGTAASCTVCHMHESDHEFVPSLDACNTAACHNGNITTLTDNGVQTEIATKMEQLEQLLLTNGLLTTENDTIWTDPTTPGGIHLIDEIVVGIHTNPGVYDIEWVKALYNYEMILDDASNGIHNPGLTRALIDNSIEAFQ